MSLKSLKFAACTALAATLGLFGQTTSAQAQDAYTGQIIMTAASFCPRGFLELNGQLLSIGTNTALFSLLGTNFGGDGHSTFGVPDLRGRVPVQHGSGPGLDGVRFGERGGRNDTQILVNNLPSHTHDVTVDTTVTSTINAAFAPSTNNPTDKLIAGAASEANFGDRPPFVELNAQSVENKVVTTATASHTGGDQPIDNMQPYLGLRFCMQQFGIFPPQ